MSVHYLSGSHGVPDVNLFQFLSFAWSVIGLSSSGNKQTLATCTSLLGALHMDIVHVANIKTTKGDVTWNDSQQQLLAQHSIAMLEQCCNYSQQSATMLQCCIELIHSLLWIVSCNITLKPLAPLKITHRKFAGILPCSSLTSNMN